MESLQKIINEIESYTVCLYGEVCGECRPIGTGILIQVDYDFYIISAYHVFDREEEAIRIENDPDETGIEHDDTDSVFILIIDCGTETFHRINDYMQAMVFSAHPEKNGLSVINEDIEYSYCHLTDAMVECLLDNNKLFYVVNETPIGKLRANDRIIISGYPQYAQKNDVELHRSFQCEINRNMYSDEKCLLRVIFDNHDAYNFEQLKGVKIPGIDGMSGGGIWKFGRDGLKPIGIILKQAPRERYVEGYRFTYIINDLKRDINKSYEANT